MLGKAIALWFAILLLAVANGALREMMLIPLLGTVPAYLASGAILSSCIVLVAILAAPWFGPMPAARWWQVGLLWLLLTLLFEFAFGHFVREQSWRELMTAYCFQGGNLWPQVLLVTLCAPRLAAWWRRLS